MKPERSAFALLFLFVCATLVNGQRPPVDDDDFEFEGSGLPPRVAEPTSATPTTEFTPHSFGGRSESGRTGDDDRLITEASGSGLHSDDEDDETAIDDHSDYPYVDYDYSNPEDEYYDYDNPIYDDSKTEDNEGETEKHVVEHVNVGHAKPTAPEATEPPSEPTEHRTVLGSPHLPPQTEAPVDEDDVYDDDEEDNQQSNGISIAPEVEEDNEIDDGTVNGKPAGSGGLGTKPVVRNASFFQQPGILAAVVGGAVVGLLCAILLVMLIVYRMRKKDEGSYPLDEPKRSLTDNNTYSKKYNKEFYA